MIHVLVALVKSLKSVANNNLWSFMKEEEMDEIIAGLLVRVSTLESMLISNKVIDKDKYTDELSVRIKEIQGALSKVRDGSFNKEESKKGKKDKLLS